MAEVRKKKTIRDIVPNLPPERDLPFMKPSFGGGQFSGGKGAERAPKPSVSNPNKREITFPRNPRGDVEVRIGDTKVNLTRAELAQSEFGNPRRGARTQDLSNIDTAKVALVNQATAKSRKEGLVPTPTEEQQRAAEGVGQFEPLPETNVGTTGEQLGRAAPDIAANTIRDIASFAGGGAITGSVVPGVGTAIGLGVGAGIGLIKSLVGHISILKQESQQTIREQTATLISSKSAINKIRYAANKGLIDGETARDLFNNQLAKIDRAERNLKQVDERFWNSKTKDDLIRIQNWNDNERRVATIELQMAILNPNPNAIPPSELMDSSFDNTIEENQ